jgi:hypothetical protein
MPHGSGGNITFQSPVILTQPTITLTTSGTTSSGNLAFNSTLDGTTANTESLTVNAGAGNVTFTGAIGSIIPLGNLTINTTGNTNLTGNVTASDSINFNSPATITNNILLTSNSINWTGNVSGTGNLTLQPLTEVRQLSSGVVLVAD